MKYLLDTCVVSELIKKQPNANVVNWLQKQDENDLYLSALTFGEIEKGIQQAPDEALKKKLRHWLEDDLRQRFDGRVVPVDLDVAIKWGVIQGFLEKEGRMMPAIDGLIAISGLVYNCTVVTRNISDMERSTANILDPWV